MIQFFDLSVIELAGRVPAFFLLISDHVWLPLVATVATFWPVSGGFSHLNPLKPLTAKTRT